MSKRQTLAILGDIIFFAAGGIIYSAAVMLFLSPNEISPGGVTGISTMLNHLFMLPVGMLVFVLNIPILIIGFLKFGGVFIIKTTAATAVVSAALDTVERIMPKVSVNPMLASVFGGILMGLGLSLFMLRGATTGGVDIIAKLINSRFPHLTVGRLMLLTDALIVAFSALVYRNVESALYSVVALYASSQVMDMMLYGADKGKIIFIITKNAEDMAKSILSLVKRGVSIIDVTGAYTGSKRRMIMCTVRRNEVSAIYKLVHEHDMNAFIVVGEAGEIFGEGFKAIK